MFLLPLYHSLWRNIDDVVPTHYCHPVLGDRLAFEELISVLEYDVHKLIVSIEDASKLLLTPKNNDNIIVYRLS